MPSVHSHDVDLHYETMGSGPALLFAHGAGGNCASWFQQTAHFSQNYKCIAFDHRGFGASQCESNLFDTNFFGDDAIAILDAANANDVVIICQSMGGWTGLRTALKVPDRIKGVLLSNTTAGIAHPAATEALRTTGKRAGNRGVATLALGEPFTNDNPIKAFLYSQIAAFSPPLDQTAMARMVGESRSLTEEQLKGIKCPVQFVTSPNDIIFPPDVIRQVSKLVPSAEVVELPYAGHSPYFETPEKFNDTVQAFLTKVGH